MSGHAFIGIELPRAVTGALEGLQQAIEQRVKAAGGEARRVPLRVLTLPLDDLGVVDGPALEAAELALERVAGRHAPFSVKLGGVHGAPDAAPRVARIGVDDDRGRLAALRAELHARLARYGFPVPEGEWRPHVPLCRVEGVDALPAIDDRGGGGVIRVARLVLFRREPGARDPRFRGVATAPLAPAGRAPDAAEDEAAALADITAELDARLDARMQQIKTTRVRRRRRRAG